MVGVHALRAVPPVPRMDAVYLRVMDAKIAKAGEMKPIVNLDVETTENSHVLTENVCLWLVGVTANRIARTEAMNWGVLRRAVKTVNFAVMMQCVFRRDASAMATMTAKMVPMRRTAVVCLAM